MKPALDRFAVVTARTRVTPLNQSCLASWRDRATYSWPLHEVYGVYGVVPAFAQGVKAALQDGAEVIACFHDDLLIEEDGWDRTVWEHFQAHPKCGLAGFGGALGVGTEEIYHAPYSPWQLARIGFRSNLRDAEAHGVRRTAPERVACFDGFSQIGRADFWKGRGYMHIPDPPLDHFLAKGVRHHAYDSWLGLLAHRLGWEAWFLPVACHHYGGQTAVADPGYTDWASPQGGDQALWAQAHQAFYDDGRGELPLRVDG